LTTSSLAPVPCWEELPAKHREELLRILGRMLTEQIARSAREGVTHDPQ
jgi:hypothetical protein